MGGYELVQLLLELPARHLKQELLPGVVDARIQQLSRVNTYSFRDSIAYYYITVMKENIITKK